MRYPLQMLPLLFLQLLNKIVWLLAVALPIWSAGHWDGQMTVTTRAFVLPVIIDTRVIPWRHVIANYVKRPGDQISALRAATVIGGA